MHGDRRMILCAGLQNSGSTLISWCFLQRHDTNGVLDMPSDVVRTSFDKVKEPILWCKMTIASFRWLDLFELYHDLGFNPEPFLVVRDMRTTYASLMKKSYGYNGTTAEDPPLRMRFRRFYQDWQLFKQNDWPIFKYEDLIEKEGSALQDVCQKLSLAWDESMISWPKKSNDLAYVGKLNKTFAASMDKGSFKKAKLKSKARISISGLAKSELEWLEETFREFTEFHDYPKNVSYPEGDEHPETLDRPRFEGTARDWVYKELVKYRTENYQLRIENEKLNGRKKD
jgi:hypothetical protein